MFKKIASRCTNALCASGVIDKNNFQIYAYGMELVVSTLVNLIEIFAISIIFFRFSSGLCFLLAFIPLRSTAGGYHANSHWACNLISVGGFVGFHYLVRFIPHEYLSSLYIACGIFSTITVCLFSPCEAVNKPLTPVQRRNNRRASMMICIVNLIIALSLWAFIESKQCTTSYFLGIFAATLSMWATKLFNKKEREIV